MRWTASGFVDTNSGVSAGHDRGELCHLGSRAGDTEVFMADPATDDIFNVSRCPIGLLGRPVAESGR